MGSPLEQTDPVIADIIRREARTQNTTVQLIVSENFTSLPCSRRRVRCSPTNTRRATPGKRYYGGNFVVDDAEDLALQCACELFGADHANVQPHCGANANMAAFLAVLEPGDKVMGM